MQKEAFYREALT